MHAPVAPTPECVRLVRELEERHGPVRHIVLPTTAVEHKIFLGPFAKKFPNADVVRSEIALPPSFCERS